MGAKLNETALVRLIMLAVSKAGAIVFRNNSGVGWAGYPIVKADSQTPIMMNAGDVLVRNARPLHAGLCTGSSDIIGYKSVTVTADMVGHRHALFTAIEAKSPTGRATVEQENFVRVINVAGGLAAVVRSVDEAIEVVNGK